MAQLSVYPWCQFLIISVFFSFSKFWGIIQTLFSSQRARYTFSTRTDFNLYLPFILGSRKVLELLYSFLGLYFQRGYHFRADTTVFLWWIWFSKYVSEKKLPKNIKPIFSYLIGQSKHFLMQTIMFFSDNSINDPDFVLLQVLIVQIIISN